MAQPMTRQSVTFKIGDQPVPGYRLVRELGRGTFGVVWLAVTENGFERALKVVNLEQKGGKKEFRALRLIKDRKILHGNLLTLIDYWLLDRDGTIISMPNSVAVDSHVPASKAGSSVDTKALVAGERTAKVQITNIAQGLQGTMIPGHETTGEERLSVRDTFQQRITDTKEEETSHAIWLVVAMELGHKTLHDRQKEHTRDKEAKSPTEVSRKGRTQVGNKEDTSPGSHTVADRNSPQPVSDDDELLPLPAEEVLPYMEQAARGLDYLHRCEIVHRDVKPQNIMLVGDVAKVCDYGLASELGDIRATTNAFTLPYAAPEAINKNQPLPASDQYSLAVTYVELRTGRWPFVSNTSTAVYAAKDTGVHHLKFVPKRAVRAVLKRALAKNPQDRFPSCGDFVKQLAKAEATRFSLFATAQATLAILAIVTVLLAASATHPDVRKQIDQRFPWLIPTPPRPAFDIAGFKIRMEAAEGLLKAEKRSEALQAYTALQAEFKQLPANEQNLKTDAILGLARAQAGQPGFLKSPNLKHVVVATLNTLSPQLAAGLKDEQGIRFHYLKVIAIERQEHPEVGPNSHLATKSLTPWERQLWTDALVNYDAPELANLLAEVKSQRKTDTPAGLTAARAAFLELSSQAKSATDVPITLQQQIALEDLHLNYHDQATYPDNLKALHVFIEKEITLDQNLLDRAHLLHLLILHKVKADASSYFDPDVLAAIANLRPELFEETRTESLSFSPAESEIIQQLRIHYKSEIQTSADELPNLALAALKFLCVPHESFQLLSQRVRTQLGNAELKEKQLAAIQTVWTDLRKFQNNEYKASSLSANDLQESIQTEADLSLEVSFADPQLNPEEALKDYADRVVKSRDGAKWFPRLLTRAQQNPVWVKSAAPALQRLILNPTEDLERNKQFDEWRLKVEGLLVREVLHADPADATAIRLIIENLKRDAVAEKGPLASLIKIECELLTTATADDVKRRDWDSRLGRALTALGNSDADLKAYGNFVQARLLATSSNARDHERAVDLVVAVLEHRPVPTWITSTRRQGAGDIFALAAIRALRLDDSDILRFTEVSSAESPKLTYFQTMATGAGLQAPALKGIAAIVEATRNDKDTNWAQIREMAHQSRLSPHAVALFERYQAARLLEYVEALAALRAADAKSPLSAELIEAFYNLIMAKQVDTYQFYSFAHGPTDIDEGVLQNIVNPVVLRSIANLENASSLTKETKTHLAFLWGAKGRLLQRSPLIVNVDPAKESDLRDSTTVALTLSNQAFNRARQLDDNINYLVGFGRTLAALPPEGTARDNRLEQIFKLVEEHDPQGKNENLGMRFLFAYATRFKGYEKADVPAIVSSEKRYELLLKDIADNDPFDLVSLCREGLSDIHLRLAYLNSKVNTAEIRCLLENRPPPDGSKAYHLKWAVKYALEASEIDNRAQKENAFTALGNAHEDFGYYLGLTEHYKDSIDAFHNAIAAARERGLPVAKAQMNYGRCLYRYALDPHSDFSKTEGRDKILQQAVNQLAEASKSGDLRPIDQAEAFYWLAVDRRALIPYVADKARLELLENILEGFHAAAETADKLKMADMYLLSLSQESQAALDLYRALAKDPVRQPQLMTRARSIDETAYQAFAKSPGTANPLQVASLAGKAMVVWPGDVKMKNRWLAGDEKIRAQWESRDSWKFEALCLRLDTALSGGAKDEVLQAKAILPTIEDIRLRNLAQARILDFEASAKYKLFDELAQTQKDITKERLRDEVEKPLVLLIAAKRFHDQIMDPETKILLDRINATSSSQIRNLSRELTVVEKRKLLDALVRSPDVEARARLFKLCNLAILTQAGDAKSKAAGTARARIAHDAIKPFFVFADTEQLFAGHAVLKSMHQVALDKLERQLKEAGDKFDVKPTP